MEHLQLTLIAELKEQYIISETLSGRLERAAFLYDSARDLIQYLESRLNTLIQQHGFLSETVETAYKQIYPHYASNETKKGEVTITQND